MFQISEILNTQRMQGVPQWRLRLSILCLTIGILGTLVGVIGASTNILMSFFGWTLLQSWEVAGVVGAIGGYFLIASVPYATPRVKDIVLQMIEIGGGIIFLGVVVFILQYPENWSIYHWHTIALVSFLYLLGYSTGLAAALRAVVGFKVRQSPGGQVRVIVETDGETVETKVDESTIRDDPHYALQAAVEDMGDVGGVGLLGGRPDEYVKTQTRRDDVYADQTND